MSTTPQTRTATKYDGPKIANPVLVNPETCVLTPFCPSGLEPYRRGYCPPCWEDYRADLPYDPCDLCCDPVKYHSDKYGSLCTRHYYQAYRVDKHPDKKFYQAHAEERKAEVKKWQQENPDKLLAYHRITYGRTKDKRKRKSRSKG